MAHDDVSIPHEHCLKSQLLHLHFGFLLMSWESSGERPECLGVCLTQWSSSLPSSAKLLLPLGEANRQVGVPSLYLASTVNLK